jgi:succinate dehydrogenase / fumarate reductase flavoprotein subunit
MEAVELGFLLDLAEIVALGALHRKESRGGHFREDFDKRDDVNFLEHTMAYRTLPGEEGAEGTSIRLGTKPVVITRYEPKERTF